MKRDRMPYIPPAERATPDLDSGKYLLMWQGPQHPGITGNMSLRLVIEGDTVVDCETHVGYLHRGFEKLMERRSWMQNFPLVCRIAVPEPDFNEYCYAAALEELSGIQIPEKAVWLRTFSLELMRLASYLMWIGGQAGSFGHGTIIQWSATMRDYVLDLFEELTGGRIYHMYIIPGGVRGDVPAGYFKHVLEVMDTVQKNLDDIELVMYHNAVFKLRAEGLGYIPPDWIDRYGITGPNARAAGIKRDLRKDLGYLAYPQLEFQPVVGSKSDAFERARLRLQEMYQCIDLIRQCIDLMPKEGPFRAKTPNPLYWKVPAGETYVAAECTRGEYGFYVVSDGSEKPRRVAVRGPSYTHAVSVMERLVRGVNIADVAGLMVSLHTYPPEIER
ncbi:MAG: NADH-quinone oxidoreductase subunit D [Spirochaetes bacterium]|nr:NADH-quinone oxidoreductase subunit D [Spirochaetota bacterium]MBU0957046.1 NADH-quinone oxidoreductase subunit D [Spirochaetota bacterium]